ncbi:MAG: ATP-binding cassette domain-containing protein [Desulfobacter sp.]|nr:MAG: ATP-binding cassette domain-containing protein [Desulfobacter sp.]
MIKNFSMDIGKGEKHLISGRSGSGKTSFLRLLLGFDPQDTGIIQINGLTFSKPDIKSIRNLIFYLSQDVDLPDETGISLIHRVLRLNRDTAMDMGQMDFFLSLLALTPGSLEKKVSVLSGGERQRLGLLLGFMLNRPIWLLDEPTSALDEPMKKSIARHIMGMNQTPELELIWVPKT